MKNLLFSCVFMTLVCVLLQNEALSQCKEEINPGPVSLFEWTDRPSNEIVHNGCKSKLKIVDVNRMLYTCKFTERQRQFFNESDLDTSRITELNGTPIGSDVSGAEDAISNLNVSSESRLKLDSTQRVVTFLENENFRLNQVYDEIAKKKSSLDEKLAMALVVAPQDTARSRQLTDTLTQVVNKINDNFRKIERVREILSEEELANFTLLYVVSEMQLIDKEIDQYSSVVKELYGILRSNTYTTTIRSLFHDKISTFNSGLSGFEGDHMMHKNHLIRRITELRSELSLLEQEVTLKQIQKNSLRQVYAALQKLEDDRIKHLDDNMRKIHEMKVWVGNDGNFECNFIGNALAGQTDLVEVELLVTPLESAKNVPGLVKHEENFEFIPKGGVKFDFSAGLAFDLGRTKRNALDDNYRLISLTDSTTQIARSRSNNVVMPGPVALINIYSRGTSWIKPALSLGVGTDFTRMSYYAGLSALLGKEDLLVLTAGVVVAKKKVLTSEFRDYVLDNDGIIDRPIRDLADVPLYSDDATFQFGYSICLTYNFTGGQEKRMKENFAKNTR